MRSSDERLKSLHDALLMSSPSSGSPRAPLPSSRVQLGVVSRRARLSLKDELGNAVARIFREAWEERDGEVVPEPEDLKLGNDARILNATVLYADMSGSTRLVDTYRAQFAAEIYKTCLACAAPIIKREGGAIAAYDGDRIMGVFIGKSKNTSAVRAAFRINGAVWDIIKPALKAQYPNTDYNLQHVVGVDTSKLLVCRIGVRNDNDLVWVGRAANYAAKLSALDPKYAIYITHSVYDSMHESVKTGGNPSRHMWDELVWRTMSNMRLYASTWKFGV